MVLTLTASPFWCASQRCRMEKIPPPTDTSSHRPDFASPPQKEPRGCMMRTPFVVRASISSFSFHFAAFFYEEQFKVMLTDMPEHTLYQLELQATAVPLQVFSQHTNILRHAHTLNLLRTEGQEITLELKGKK